MNNIHHIVYLYFMYNIYIYVVIKIRLSSPKHASPSSDKSSSSSSNQHSSSAAAASSKKRSLNSEMELEEEKNNQMVQTTETTVNDVLMNPVKILMKQYSVNIKEMSQKIVNRGFITEYCDCSLRYSLDSALATNKSNPSKINKVLSDMNTKIKQLCHIKEEDKPSDEKHPLHSLPTWPHISRKPETSSTEWEKWNKSRETLADKIVRALQNAYTDKTTFKGTISAIYNKLTK